MAENPARTRRPRRHLGAWLATAGTVVGLITGGLTLRDEILGKGDEPAPPAAAGGQRIPYFDGVASHLERSEELLGFLQTHDGDPVRLQVGFQLGLDDYSVDGFGVQRSGGPADLSWIALLTKCSPPLDAEEQRRLDLGFRNEIQPGRCMGVELLIPGPDRDDSGVYVTHGQPRIEGWFAVDFGDLHQGMTGITLKPISPEQASTEA